MLNMCNIKHSVKCVASTITLTFLSCYSSIEKLFINLLVLTPVIRSSFSLAASSTLIQRLKLFLSTDLKF